ncbi:MotA/TolQ/ExbB proton channel family protein [Ancylomarina sp. 16SWW S1-10-2]|uniref:MotA/TolQ/ExbB proton channel family protein n=1 Tax=Ancylomarina sp. 16SWW S1-10-2 TaxID=2499681 RepID=UPI00189D6788|nr:MotA/TolQ/ExbB proton channel family protein [Ancylomarina sp. 16SWW S1-10-2]
MTVVVLTGIAAILWSLFSLIKFIKVGFIKKRHLDAILFLGSLSFFIGLLGQGIGITGALEAIQAFPNVSQEAVAGGIRVSMIAPLTGAILFTISGIFWFILRYLNARKQDA